MKKAFIITTLALILSAAAVPCIVNSFGVSSGVTSCFIFGEMTEGY